MVEAVRDHVLAGLEPEPGAVEVHLDLVRFEGDQAADTPDLGPSVGVRRGRPARVRNVVMAAQALVRAERLAFGRAERGFIDAGAWDIPARGETGLKQRQRAGGVGPDAIAAPTTRWRLPWRRSMRW